MQSIDNQIEKALYYRELLNKKFFAKKSNEVTEQIEQEIKSFINSKLQALLGISEGEQLALTQSEIAQVKSMLKGGLVVGQPAVQQKTSEQPKQEVVESEGDEVFEEYETPDGRIVKIRAGALKKQAIDESNKPKPMPTFEQVQAHYITNRYGA
jgi:hypothetical protein